MVFSFDDEEIKKYLFEGEFGLEKESLRIDEKGYLAHTPHPFPKNKNIDRDFCENQVELITEVKDSIDEVCKELMELQKKTTEALLHLETGKEYLWSFSNPPYIRGEDDILIAHFNGELHGKEIYREYLAEKYGRKKMLFSGVHFNFSFPEKVLKESFKKSGYLSYRKFKDDVYIKLCKKLVDLSWLIVYLTAASSVTDGSFFEAKKTDVDIMGEYASPRCAKDGYWNKFTPIFNFENLETYTDGISEYIEKGRIKAAAELYYPVRLKPRGEYTVENLRETGVNHIELRMLDLNPFHASGVSKNDLSFIHLLIVYLMLTEDEEFGTLEQTSAIKNMKNAALFDTDSFTIEHGWYDNGNINDEAGRILSEMENVLLKSYPEKKSVIKECIDFQMSKIENPSERYAVKIREAFTPNYVKKGVELAKFYVNKN